jgi:hypothetical protein
MDAKDILLQNENSLPTLQENLSTSTVQGELPTIATSSSGLWKFGISTIAGLLGAYYLMVGKRQNDVQKMIIGVVLTLASFLLFV